MARTLSLTMAVVLCVPVAVRSATKTATPPASLERSPADTWTADANLMVEREVGIGTRIGGIIDSIQAQRGEAVRPGQALATLDQREFELDRRAAEAAFSAAEADFKRYQELSSQKLASKAELEQRKARYEQAKVDLEKAKLTIDRSVIRAPFEGIVVDRTARVGQKVLVEDTAPLFKISAMRPLLARVYLSEKWLDRLHVGDSVSVTSAQFSRASSSGKISFLSPVVDPASGTFQVIVDVAPDAHRIFRPGTAVKITFGRAAR